MLEPLARTAGRIDEHGVGLGSGGRGDLGLAACGGERQDLEGKLGRGGELLQLVGDALRFLLEIGLCREAAVAPPTGLLAPLVELIDEHGLHPQRHARRQAGGVARPGRFGGGACGGRPGKARQGGGTDSANERAAVHIGRGGATAGATRRCLGRALLIVWLTSW